MAHPGVARLPTAVFQPSYDLVLGKYELSHAAGCGK